MIDITKDMPFEDCEICQVFEPQLDQTKMFGDEKCLVSVVWCDDISFCPYKGCRRKTCPRNQMNIRDRTIPHSFFVERPPDCPYRKKQDDFYHTRKKVLQDDG